MNAACELMYSPFEKALLSLHLKQISRMAKGREDIDENRSMVLSYIPAYVLTRLFAQQVVMVFSLTLMHLTNPHSKEFPPNI